jgi:thiamine biosynthesis lipoprotein
MGLIQSTDGAVATSGDYERFAIVDGQRFHHIVDPRSGKPASGCMSATVTVPTSPTAGELADSLATALCVLGHDKGFQLVAKHPGVEAAILAPDGILHKTKGFLHKIEFQPPAKPQKPAGPDASQD